MPDPVREQQAIFLSEIIEIIRSLEQRGRDMEAFFGCDTLSYLDEEIERLWKVVLGLSNVTAMRNSYHDKLVEQGAACVAWSCLEDVNEKKYTDKSAAIELARWFLDYGEGKIFGSADDLDINTDVPESEENSTAWPSNSELVETHGLLPPRKQDSDHDDESN